MCGEQESSQVKKIMDDQNSKMEDIKNYLKDRSLSIDEALQQSAEVRAFEYIRHSFIWKCLWLVQ